MFLAKDRPVDVSLGVFFLRVILSGDVDRVTSVK